MLDMDKLEKANNDMYNIRMWKLDTVFKTVAKVSFCLWGSRFPRDFETIMTKLMDEFRTQYVSNDDEFIYIKFFDTYLINMSGNCLVRNISDVLRSIPEFIKWNEPDDSGFFIDLDAFDQNVFCELRSEIIMSEYFEVNNND